MIIGPDIYKPLANLLDSAICGDINGASSGTKVLNSAMDPAIWKGDMTKWINRLKYNQIKIDYQRRWEGRSFEGQVFHLMDF